MYNLLYFNKYYTFEPQQHHRSLLPNQQPLWITLHRSDEGEVLRPELLSGLTKNVRLGTLVIYRAPAFHVK